MNKAANSTERAAVTTDAGKAKCMTALCNNPKGNIAACNALKINKNGKLLYWAGISFCCQGRRNAFFPAFQMNDTDCFKKMPSRNIGCGE
jgi:hypothetical protein